MDKRTLAFAIGLAFLSPSPSFAAGGELGSIGSCLDHHETAELQIVSITIDGQEQRYEPPIITLTLTAEGDHLTMESANPDGTTTELFLVQK